MTKKTYGQVLLDHSLENHTIDDDLYEYTAAIGSDVFKNLYHVANLSKNKHPYNGKDFYLCFTFTIDWFALGLLRDSGKPITTIPTKPKVWARQSCPTPLYKMSVFKYHQQTGTVEFLWTLPPQWRYLEILAHKTKYVEDPQWSNVAKFVILDASGELLNWVKKENGSKFDVVIKITTPTA